MSMVGKRRGRREEGGRCRGVGTQDVLLTTPCYPAFAPSQLRRTGLPLREGRYEDGSLGRQDCLRIHLELRGPDGSTLWEELAYDVDPSLQAVERTQAKRVITFWIDNTLLGRLLRTITTRGVDTDAADLELLTPLLFPLKKARRSSEPPLATSSASRVHYARQPKIDGSYGSQRDFKYLVLLALALTWYDIRLSDKLSPECWWLIEEMEGRLRQTETEGSIGYASGAHQGRR